MRGAKVPCEKKKSRSEMRLRGPGNRADCNLI